MVARARELLRARTGDRRAPGDDHPDYRRQPHLPRGAEGGAGGGRLSRAGRGHRRGGLAHRRRSRPSGDHRRRRAARHRRRDRDPPHPARRGAAADALPAADRRPRITGAELRALDAGADAFVRKEEDIGGHPGATQRHAAQRRRRRRQRSAHRQPAGPEEDPRGRRQRDLSAGARGSAARETATTWCSRAPAKRRSSCSPCSRSTASCSICDAGHRRPGDLPPHQGVADHARHSASSCSPRSRTAIAMIEGLERRRRRLHRQVERLRGAAARACCAQIRRKQFEDENRRIREQLLRKELEAAEARAARELAETRADARRGARVEEQGARSLQLFGGARSARAAAQHRRLQPALLEDHAASLDEEGQPISR